MHSLRQSETSLAHTCFSRFPPSNLQARQNPSVSNTESTPPAVNQLHQEDESDRQSQIQHLQEQNRELIAQNNRLARLAYSGGPFRIIILREINAAGGYFIAHAPGKVNGINVPMLIDRGSGITTCSQDLAPLFTIFQLQKSELSGAVGVSGHIVNIAGAAEVELQMGNAKTPALLNFAEDNALKRYIFEVIVDYNVLKNLPPFTMNIAQRVLTIAGSRVPLGLPGGIYMGNLSMRLVSHT